LSGWSPFDRTFADTYTFALGCEPEIRDKSDVVREYDYLTLLGQCGKPFRHIPSSDVIQRTYRVIQDDGRLGRLKVGLRKESGQTKGRLFSKYARLENKPTGGEKSTGLGLFICKQLIEAHGGQIGARKNEDQGATFWFSLPASEWTSTEQTPCRLLSPVYMARDRASERRRRNKAQGEPSEPWVT